MRDDDLRSLLETEARLGSFGPGFADRVMARVAHTGGDAPTAQLADALVSVFYRVAVAGVVVALGLGTLNVTRASDLSGSTFDAALHIPAVTFESAYEMEARALLESFVSTGEGAPNTISPFSHDAAESDSSAGAS